MLALGPVIAAGGLNIAEDTEIVYRRRYMHYGDPDAIIQIQEGWTRPITQHEPPQGLMRRCTKIERSRNWRSG
jgi:hypothetical protein